MKMVSWKKTKDWIEKNEGLIVILLVVVALRIPSLYEPNRYADEDIYLALGQGLRKGLVFYRDIHDNKPPLLYLMAALAGNVMWFRFILMVWNLINVVLVWKLAEKLVKNKWGIILTTGLFALLSTIPLTEGNIANGEVFMIMPTTAAVWWLWSLVTKKESGKINLKSYLGVGILFAAGFLFKVPVLFEMLTVLFWLVVYEAKTLKDFWKKIASKRVWLVVLGFLLPVVLSAIYYWLKGAGESYLRSALGQNIGYLSSWEGGSKPFYQSGLFVRGMITAVAMAGVWIFKKRLGKEFGMAALWFVGAWFGSMLSGRPYPHYLVELVPPGALLLGMVFFAAKKERLTKVGVGLVLVGMTVWSIITYKFWYYKSWPYYKNFVEYLWLGKSEEEYRAFWGEGVNRNYQVADFITKMTEPGEKIFVWGTEPAIYVLSNRLPVGKYTVAYHIKDFGAMEETAKLLLEEKPRVIVKMTDEGKSYSELEGILSGSYGLIKEIDGAMIYLRVDHNL